jgi:hypothetical protein
MRSYQETLEKLNHLSQDFEELNNINYWRLRKGVIQIHSSLRSTNILFAIAVPTCCTPSWIL